MPEHRRISRGIAVKLLGLHDNYRMFSGVARMNVKIIRLFSGESSGRGEPIDNDLSDETGRSDKQAP
ncbi:hypothetical protein ACWT_2562 [Actinoplanes sp. SE50]|nr:hypothetical protein ACPL_2984 [Actinoplanes sp. SE50/110]ATO81977.1 hypothetical protein ACWT_2562 [Actinoplanes sp. SE50]SLL99385.1 hypothetical protein ACSP50_2616 [Actinoplanes sp. SE50/110]